MTCIVTAARLKYVIALLFAGALALRPCTSAAAEDKDAISIRSERDYQKYGMPKLGHTLWTEQEYFTALKVSGELAKVNPAFLPSFKFPHGFQIFRRFISPQKLSTPTGEKYFAALEKLYLEHRKAGPARFDEDFPRIQSARLQYALNHLKAGRGNKAVADEIYVSLMSWLGARFDLKNDFSEMFHMRMKQSESFFHYIVKKMPPGFQEKVLLKIDAMAAANPKIALKREIVPDFMEKLLKSMPTVRPKTLKFVMKPAKSPDMTKTWAISDLMLAYRWLLRQAEIDKSKLPRIDSAMLRKMLDPKTIKSIVSTEGGIQQLGAAFSSARGLYLESFRIYQGAGLKEYMDEGVPLFKVFFELWWEDLEKHNEWKQKMQKTDKAVLNDFVAKQFNRNAMTFCAWAINDAAFARVNFPLADTAERQAFAVKYYPQAFRMLPEESRAKAAAHFFHYKSNTEAFIRTAKIRRDSYEDLLKQKAMVDKIEAAIKADIPKSAGAKM